MGAQTGSERASDLLKVTQQSPVQCPVTALADAIHFSPERPSQASVPSCPGGLGQEMEQSLEIFIEGINKEWLKSFPVPGPIS